MSWYQLADIYREAAELAQFDRDNPIACPNDGEPLRPGPDGQLFCPSDGWRPDGSYIGG